MDCQQLKGGLGVFGARLPTFNMEMGYSGGSDVGEVVDLQSLAEDLEAGEASSSERQQLLRLLRELEYSQMQLQRMQAGQFQAEHMQAAEDIDAVDGILSDDDAR